MSGWISPAQFERDHNGRRNTCGACGHDGTDTDPLVVDLDDGMRIHRSHYSDPRTGFYGRSYR